MSMKTEFTDGIAAEAHFDDFKDFYENMMLDGIRKQTETDPRIEWGDGLNVLIISDRALGRAEGLRVYLYDKTDFKNICLCRNITEIKVYLESVTPIIIIFVGMAQKKINYEAIEMAKKKNPFVLIAMFAFLDGIIETECERYQIRYAFSCNKPVKDGLEYLRLAFRENRQIVQDEIDKNDKNDVDLTKEKKGSAYLTWLEKIHRLLFNR